MKRLIICADGTWNDEDRICAPTNVAKIHKALQTYHEEGVNQLVYYQSGVGTKWGERLRGGAFGIGLNRNIRACYEFLVDHFEEGDELYFFGFSRGAYTVRSLAGLIRNSGIVRDRSMVMEAWKLYRSRKPKRRPKEPAARSFRQTHAKPARASDGHAANDQNDLAYSPDIKFIGVWDTVGSLGYPLPFFPILKPLLLAVGINWWFHDTKLSRIVQHAYHALAIHERRTDFPPTLWEQQLDAEGRPQRPDQVLEQVWFTGVHCDVGGGYGATGLSDIAFRWMVERASGCGLAFRTHALEAGPHVAPDPLGVQHESFSGVFAILDALRFKFRGTPRKFSSAATRREQVAPAVLARYRMMPFASWPEGGAAHSFRATIKRLVEKTQPPAQEEAPRASGRVSRQDDRPASSTA